MSINEIPEHAADVEINDSIIKEYKYKFKIYEHYLGGARLVSKAKQLCTELGIDAKCYGPIYRMGNYQSYSRHALFKTKDDLLKFKLVWEGND